MSAKTAPDKILPLALKNSPDMSASLTTIKPGNSARDLAIGVWYWRIVLLVGLFVVEILAKQAFFNLIALSGLGGVGGWIGGSAIWSLRGSIAFAGSLAFFAYLKDPSALRERFQQANSKPIAWKFLTAHFGAIALFFFLTNQLVDPSRPGIGNDLLAIGWLVTGVGALVAGAVAFIPAGVWVDIVRVTGWLPVYAALASVGACLAGYYMWALWEGSAAITLQLAGSVLALFHHGVVMNTRTAMLGTERFQVVILPPCSGLEGAGLMLGFSTLYLVCFRRQSRFPHALVLIPASVLFVLALNVLRIAALILIGDAGQERIAVGGFHSQAGWIAFTLVALGCAISAHRIEWLKADGLRRVPVTRQGENPAAPYLAPFLAILAIGMVGTAASAGFEWLYPVRFVAAAAALWMFRGQLGREDWRVGRTGVTAGAIVFALWVAFDRFTGAGSAGMPETLATASPTARFAWIAVRALAASVTVPVAEELAFRGFLMRRLAASDFEALPFRNVTLLALLISSIAFGSLHGSRWIPATVAGVIYGFSAMRTGRIGEATAAHATTNALLAGYVLAFGQWQFW